MLAHVVTLCPIHLHVRKMSSCLISKTMHIIIKHGREHLPQHGNDAGWESWRLNSYHKINHI